jgi:uncharacterized protein (DUF1330 family)
MKGYWLILGTEISDQQAQAQYANLWQPIAAKYRARLHPLKVPPILKEARDIQRVVVVEFPSFELAKACYDDVDYAAAKIQALNASDRQLLILEGDLF